MSLFESEFSASSDNFIDHLSTTRGRFPVIGYYGNEVDFFKRMKKNKDKTSVIILQHKTIWIEEYIYELFKVVDIKKKAVEITFENIISKNYGLRFNFNKFICEKGHTDVELIRKHFNKITDFIQRGSLIDKFLNIDISFDARNSGQIILQQLIEQPLNNLEEMYNFLLYNTHKLEFIYEHDSLKTIFLNNLEYLGIDKNSILLKLIKKEDFDTIRRIIELILIKSIYAYLDGISESPVCNNLAEFKIFVNTREYEDIFHRSGAKDFINDTKYYLKPSSIFNFRGIEPYIRKIELKEFIEHSDFPNLKKIEEATGIFQFEWDSLVKNNHSLTLDYRKVKDHFHSKLFEHHFGVLDAWYDLELLTTEKLKIQPNDLQKT